MSSFSARIAIPALMGAVIGFGAGPPTVQITAPAGPPIQAGAAPSTFTITVANDAAGDLPTVTSFTLNGAACTADTCGSFGAVTGISGSGNYSMSYTPPASLVQGVAPTVTVSPSVAGQGFAGTLTFAVYPAGVVVGVSIAGGLNVVPVGSAARTLTYTTYHDVGNAGLTFTMTASGYACQGLSQNSCGSLGPPNVSTGGTTTTTTITYTPPALVPDAPYDRVRIQATPVADPTKFVSQNFLLGMAPGPGPIGYGQKFDTALTGGGPVAVTASFNDAAATKTVTWTLTANGAACPAPTCGTLGTPSVISNGNIITSTVSYTPPASVPDGDGQSSPLITAALTSNPAVADGFAFDIVDGTCATGNEGLLNGQYAFLMKGGGATTGYNAMAGSFTADGGGNITGGLEDINRPTGVFLNLTVAGSYSVGPDNRGCVTLTNSTGGVEILRIALGTISGGTATQGSITRFDDTTGQNPRVGGILKQQNLTNLASSTISGTYAFGSEGVDSSGYRFAEVGLVTADGAGNITNNTFDFNDHGNLGTVSGGSGSYSVVTNAAGGRGTLQAMVAAGGGTITVNSALYVISASDFFLLSTDPTDTSHPIAGGEAKLQTGPFSTGMLASGSGYVFWSSGVDGSNGESIATIGQVQFTDGSGTATVTVDSNAYGSETPEQSVQANFSVDASGRMTVTGLGPDGPVIYLVDSTQGFSLEGSGSAASGYVQQQTLNSFSTSAVSGQFFVGGGSATAGSSFDSGVVVVSPGEPSGTVVATTDSSKPNCGQFQNCEAGNGLHPNKSSGGLPYTFSAGASAPGQGCIGSPVGGASCIGGALIGYIISPSQLVLMPTSSADNLNAAEIIVGQQ
jgi:hypothetical protein